MDDFVVPGFVVEQQLHGSVSGPVYAAYEQATGRPVTLRRLRLDVQVDRERLRQQAASLARMSHPHLQSILGLAETAGDVVLVLEAADGGSLGEILEQRQVLSPGEVVTACAPIAQALEAVHRRGLVHGDVVPQNMVFAIDGRPMLAGLGLSTLVGAAPGNPWAEPDLLAPEVAHGYPPTTASDVYGLAAAAVSALLGSPQAVRQLVQLGVDPITAGILERALDPDPNRRPSATDLVDGLFALAPPEPVLLPDAWEEEQAAEPFYDQPTGLQHSPMQPPPMQPPPMQPPAMEPPAGFGSRQLPPIPPSTLPPLPTGPLSAGSPPPAGSPLLERTGPQHRAADDSDEHSTDGPSRTGRTRTQPQPRVKPKPKTQPRTRRSGGRFWRGMLIMLVVVLFVGGAVWAGPRLVDLARGDGDSGGAVSASTLSAEEARQEAADLCGAAPAPSQPPADPADWKTVIEELYDIRSQAFADLDPALLCEVYAATSNGLVSDLQRLSTYEDAGVKVEGMSFEVQSATLVGREASRVFLEISDSLSGFQLVAKDGTVLNEVEGVESATWNAELVPAPDGQSWLFG